MRIIAQKTDALNTNDFLNNAIEKDYIDAIALNIAITKDNKILTYNVNTNIDANINTIESSTLEELQNYEIEPLENTLENLNQKNMTKDIYINVNPFRTGPLTDYNIQETTEKMNLYIDLIAESINQFPNLKIHLHSINRSIVTIMKQKIKNRRIGFVIYNSDLNFVDVDYYIMTMNSFNDTIIDLLLKEKKETILYIHTDYYLSFIYDHYMGDRSTPYLQQVFKQLGLLTNYPEITYKIFIETNE